MSVGREESDRFTPALQFGYQTARAEGFYGDESITIAVPGTEGTAAVVSEDEHPQWGTTVETLPSFKAAV